jgi:hypothetical protein
VGDILRAVAEQAGIKIVVEQGVSGKVTISFRGLTPEEGIKRIAEGAGFGDFALEYARISGEDGSTAYRVEKCSVFRHASPDRPVVRQQAGSNDMVPVSSSGAPPDGTQPERRNTAASQKLSGKEQRSGLNVAGGVTTRDATRQTSSPARHSAEKVRSSTIEPEGSPAQSPASSAGAGRGTVTAIPQRIDQLRGGGSASLPGSGREEQVRSLMRDAQRGNMPAIGLLGKMGIRQASPLLERIVARSPEGSPAKRAASEALRQLDAARRIQ